MIEKLMTKCVQTHMCVCQEGTLDLYNCLYCEFFVEAFLCGEIVDAYLEQFELNPSNKLPPLSKQARVFHRLRKLKSYRQSIQGCAKASSRNVARNAVGDFSRGTGTDLLNCVADQLRQITIGIAEVRPQLVSYGIEGGSVYSKLLAAEGLLLCSIRQLRPTVSLDIE